jgi:hypothetical protein
MRLCGAACALALAMWPATAGLASELPTHHSVTLSDARVSTAANGDVVVALQARGDLRGLLTLTVHQNSDATISGEWSLVSAYFQDVDENGDPIEVEPAEHDHEHDGDAISVEHYEEGVPHVERIKYVNLGIIGGSVDGGLLVIGADGAVTGIEHVQLAIVSSTLTFEGAAGGGSLDSPVLHDGGSVSLTF